MSSSSGPELSDVLRRLSDRTTLSSSGHYPVDDETVRDVTKARIERFLTPALHEELRSALESEDATPADIYWLLMRSTDAHGDPELRAQALLSLTHEPPLVIRETLRAALRFPLVGVPVEALRAFLARPREEFYTKYIAPTAVLLTGWVSPLHEAEALLDALEGREEWARYRSEVELARKRTQERSRTS